MQTHKDLKLYQKAMDLVTNIYIITKKLPKDEQYGLVTQIRRAAVSIPSNIAEGAGRLSQKELRNFLSIANGSASELETQLHICHNLNYITQEELDGLVKQINDVKKLCYGLIRKINSKYD